MLSRHLSVLAAAFAVVVTGAIPSIGATGELPVLWTVGGESAGTESAGQGARISVDPAGNVAVVSGPSKGRDLAVTSYTQDGVKRWRRSITPVSGTFDGDWVVAAPNGGGTGDPSSDRVPGPRTSHAVKRKTGRNGLP